MWSSGKIPHGSPDSKAVCAVTVEAGIHTDTAKAHKTGCLQTAGRSMAGGSTVFDGADTEKNYRNRDLTENSA